MTDTDSEHQEAAEAVVKRRKTPSIVWLIPIVAALVGGWLGWKTINERGPLITIQFDSAAGLEAGKTRIRYRDVDLGLVETVSLDEDLEHVLVTARMDKQASPFLTETTKLWIVRARVSAREVSGLSTLFSGAYIALSPGEKGEATTRFIGLESPPVITGEEMGRQFNIKAERLGALNVGSPVYHRQIQVGRVTGFSFNEKEDIIDLQVFVDSPYHKRVFTGTRFWKADGIDITVDASGLTVDTESIETIVSGGIAFENPVPQQQEEIAKEFTTFRLYPNRRSILEQEYVRKQYFVMYFNESVRGLAPGAPVEFRGIRIGQVKAVSLDLDMDRLEFRIPVVAEVEPERINITGQGPVEGQKLMGQLVESGLRAQLKLANLLTGQLTVALDIFPDAPKASVVYGGTYPEMPTLKTPYEEIAGTFNHLLKKLDAVPYDELSSSLQNAMATLDSTLKDVRVLANGLGNNLGSLTPEARNTMDELRKTLEDVRKNLGPDSRMSHETREAMEEFQKASRSVKALADYLERHPESLIRGKQRSEP